MSEWVTAVGYLSQDDIAIFFDNSEKAGQLLIAVKTEKPKFQRNFGFSGM